MDSRPTILALPADEHCGSPLGLMPEEGWVHADGNRTLPNETQERMSRVWKQSWERVRAARAGGARLIVVNMGDAVEGLHHDSRQVLTSRIEEQEGMHVEVMRQGLELAQFNYAAGDRIMYVSGTTAHTGPGSASEERIARAFSEKGIIPSSPDKSGHNGGRFIFGQLKLEINGRLFDLAHHGAYLSRLPWNKTNPLRGALSRIYWRCLQEHRRMPDVWARAHRHVKAADVFVADNGVRIEGFVTPAFQGRTEFVTRVAADEEVSVGMLFFEIDPAGRITPYWEIEAYDPAEVITF